MASQAGQVHAPTHSGAETALSGAGAVIQDDGVAVDSPASPLAAGSQASVGPAGEPHLTQAAASAVYANSMLMANDSALSVADVSGSKSENIDTSAASTLMSLKAQLDIQLQATSWRSMERNKKAAGVTYDRTHHLQTHRLRALYHKRRLIWQTSSRPTCQLCHRSGTNAAQQCKSLRSFCALMTSVKQ